MYNHKEIEAKWVKYWNEFEVFKTDVWDFSKPKFYCLDMFPYPSGSGLHAGHPEGYTATDIISRMKRMQGYNVLHPMGWDAFGLPAEQYAINTGNHPEEFTKANIEIFKKQLMQLGLSYDWSKEISTSDPSYYKWTQWIFKNLYEDGLAKYIDMPVNWCEELGTVLANDEIIDGKSERGGYPVIRKNMKQWVIDIPSYAEKLLLGLDEIDWPESTKEMQRNWIGKSIGAEVKFKVANTKYSFEVFTTRSDTLFGATYCVLSPEHALVDKITTDDKLNEVKAYQKISASKSDLERTELNKNKTGVFTGAYAVNPVNNKKIPIWISDYVLASYGTGAIMAVPAHDERDYEFAKKFNLDIIPVIEKVTGERKDNEILKKSIVAVVYNPKNNKYLTINWGNKGGRLFIGGTIKDNETAKECAIREIKEETGYNDLKYLHTSFPINHHYYAYNKNKAYEIECDLIYFELLSDSKVDTVLDDEEKNNFVVEWVDENKVISEVKDELHSTAFEFRSEKPYVGDGKHINSEFLDGLNKQDAIDKMNEWVEEKGLGKRKVNYRLRDWIFARQRYWGEPIPIIHFNDKMQSLNDNELPLILPKLDDYKPSKTGASPLEKATDWINVSINNKFAKRETSTMPGSAGSSWYFLRYIDSNNEKEIANQELLNHWLPVDLYIGGPEHAVGHLLYSRMWNNYLYDKGIINVKEPFKKLVHQGMILGANNIKMGKRHPEFVVNPSDIVEQFGADTLRLYEMFMGPLDADKPWNNEAVEASRKFLDRIYRLYQDNKIKNEANQNLEMIYHQTVKKITEDYENLKFNTAIAQMMIFINAVYKEKVFPKEYAQNFLILLNPICPFLTEELWSTIFNEKESLTYAKWPTYDNNKIIIDEITLAISVNGKVRSTINIPVDLNEREVKTLALKESNIIKHIEDKEIVKIIIIKNKIVNIVVK